MQRFDSDRVVQSFPITFAHFYFLKIKILDLQSGVKEMFGARILNYMPYSFDRKILPLANFSSVQAILFQF